MESPKKFNDCYFYYYSTCIKGDSCVFRHEPSALGCEIMCADWQQSKCMKQNCGYRHMELRKNRKQIPCYWESQPGGCRKKHCVFMHKNPDARTDGIAPSHAVMGQPSQPQPLECPVLERPPAPPAPALPVLWQQQRQVVLDSTILGVLPSNDLLAGRRVAHEPSPQNPYAPLAVDPLVVNFEEESDNETPSSTPTKHVKTEESALPTSKTQELMILEKIQAEAAAYYNYNEVKEERKVVRTNLNMKYDRLSLDELAGKKPAEKRASLDFKVMSLDEIRAKKRTNMETVLPIINIGRKRKLSTQETIIDSNNKIIKVVRSNSIVYKKVDSAANSTPSVSKVEQKANLGVGRTRTVSELSSDIQDDELDDDCYKLDKIEVEDKTTTPLFRNVSVSSDKAEIKMTIIPNKVDINIENDVESTDDDDDVIELDTSANMAEPVAIVDISDNEDSDVSDVDIILVKNVPDVVASCRKKSSTDQEILDNINNILDD